MQPARQRRQRRPAGLLEPWFAPFALVNGAAVGITPILLPVVAARHGLGHVGIVMGAFNLGAFAAPLIGSLADQRHAYRALATACAAVTAVSLWLFPLAGNALQVLLALGDGAGFAGAVTIANLLVVERHPRAEWNQRLGWLETALSVGQGGALFLSAWLSGLSPKDGLLIGALVPAAAIPLALLLIPRMPAGRPAPPEPASPGPGHHLASIGHVGEWGPASPSRVHRAWMWPRRRLTGVTGLLRGGLGWMLAAWLPAYAGLGHHLLAVPRAVPAGLRHRHRHLRAGLRGHRVRQPAAVRPGRPGQPALRLGARHRGRLHRAHHPAHRAGRVRRRRARPGRGAAGRLRRHHVRVVIPQRRLAGAGRAAQARRRR